MVIGRIFNGNSIISENLGIDTYTSAFVILYHYAFFEQEIFKMAKLTVYGLCELDWLFEFNNG